MASADCCSYHCSQSATHTYTHKHFLPVCHHRVSNSLRFASLTSPSQSLCTAAGRGSRHTLTHTHTLLCSTPIFFGREETRSEQMQDSTSLYSCFLAESCCKIRLTLQGFLALFSKLLQSDSEYRHYRRNMHSSACQPIKRQTKSGKTEKRIWTYVVDFGSGANMQCSSGLFLDGSEEAGAMPEVLSLLFFKKEKKNTLAAADPLGSGYA